MAQRAAPRAAAARAKIDLLIANDTHLESLEARSVDDPPRTLRRIRSVLKESGKLIVLEHVRSPIERVARVQNSIAPFWERITGDCRLNRDTGTELARAGFNISGLRLCRFSRFFPVQDLLIGAIAPSAARSPR